MKTHIQREPGDEKTMCGRLATAVPTVTYDAWPPGAAGYCLTCTDAAWLLVGPYEDDVAAPVEVR